MMFWPMNEHSSIFESLCGYNRSGKSSNNILVQLLLDYTTSSNADMLTINKLWWTENVFFVYGRYIYISSYLRQYVHSSYLLSFIIYSNILFFYNSNLVLGCKYKYIFYLSSVLTLSLIKFLSWNQYYILRLLYSRKKITNVNKHLFRLKGSVTPDKTQQ